MKSPRQPSLFDDSPEPAPSAALVTVPKRQGRLSAAQRTFNRLTERIRRGRETLAMWDAFMPRFQQRVAAELSPIEDQLSDAQRRIVLLLDQLLAASKETVRLTRKHRRKARLLLLDLADDLLQTGPDPEIEALYDRYSDQPHAEQRQEDLAMAEALVEEMFGPEATEGHEAESVEELLRHASERFVEHERRARAASESRGRHRAAERKAQEARDAATLSVREIYRKLASALHPDRETDSAERSRKTALMQRANQAYARNDLLELLALQIEIEQIDASALANMPEQRLAHYNQVLQEQTALLDVQIEQRVAVFRIELDLGMHAVTPRIVEQALSARVVQARSALEKIERELTRLADPNTRRAALDDLPEVEDEDGELENLAALAAMFDQERKTARAPARKRKRRRR
jgi:hypothetical protein